MSNASQEQHQEDKLTPRQREILALLQAGKVNKEVARELGIGVGTVKQHLIAIFRKLNVKNRTMAVSKSVTTRQALEAPLELPLSEDASFDTSSLERRPCVVLMLQLPETTDAKALSEFQSVITNIAQKRHAVCIHRHAHIAELVWGLDTIHDLNPLFATVTAYEIKEALNEHQLLDLTNTLSGFVTAGMSIASMNRFGGWNEEVFAGTIIGKARAVTQRLKSGQFIIDPIIHHLLESHGLTLSPMTNEHDIFDRLIVQAIPNHGEIAGRHKERQRIKQLLDNDLSGPPLVVLKGDSGMGKTQIAHAILAERNQQYVTTAYFRLLPYRLTMYAQFDANIGDAKTFVHWVHAQQSTPHWQHVNTIIIDDAHLLHADDIEMILFLLKQQGYAAIITSRNALSLPKHYSATFVSVEHLSTSDMNDIALQLAKNCTPFIVSNEHLQQAIQLSHGVPRFLYELLVECKPLLTLSLITTILARIDHLGLDRFLLRAIAFHQDNHYQPDLTHLNDDIKQIQESLRRCIDKGILVKKDTERYAFHHPLVRMVIHELFIKVPRALQQD